MATINSLQKAQIIEVLEDLVRVRHPDISNNLRTYLTAAIAAGGTTATVKDNSGWADNEWFLLGYPGEPQTEEDDINQASITRGTSLTVTNTLKFAHGIDTPMTRVFERKIRVKGASTLTGAQVEVTGSPFTIQWDKPFTECKVTGTQYAYYFAEFSDGAGSPVYGTQSDGVARTGLGSTTVEEITQNALDLTDEEINDNGKINRKFLLKEFNNWQDDVAARRNWSHEIVDEETLTTTTLVHKYALSGLTSTLKAPNSNKSIISCRFADEPLHKMDWLEYLDCMWGVANTTVSTAITAADTSCVLTDTYEFNETGSILVGSDTANYTANTESTGTLTGIPASGTGSFASSHAAGAQVWQGISAGKPAKFVIYNDYIYLNRPISSTEAGKKLKLAFYKKISRVTEFSDTTDIPFYHLAQYYLAARIEYKKSNFEKAQNWLNLYEIKIAQEAKKDRVPVQKKFIPSGYDELETGGKYYKTTESSTYNNYSA